MNERNQDLMIGGVKHWTCKKARMNSAVVITHENMIYLKEVDARDARSIRPSFGVGLLC